MASDGLRDAGQARSISAPLPVFGGTLGDDGVMDAGRFPIFADFYSCYLHEDWQLEDRNPDAPIRAFKNIEGSVKSEALGDEMRRLLATDPSEADLEVALGPFGTLRPQDVEVTIRQWIEHLISVLDQ